MRGILTFFLLTLLSVVCVLASEPPEQYRPLPPLRVQDELEKVWVKKRYEFVPTVLKKYGYDAWIITQREYAEDTVFRSLHSSTTTFSARRRTLFLFHTNPDVPSPLLLIDNQQTLWDTLLATLDKVDPKKIAVNVSLVQHECADGQIDDDMAFSDGLHTGEGQLLLQKLGPKWAKRVSSERAIGVEVVAARVGGEEQLSMYRLMTENVWRMIEEGFSNEVITVGETTPTDVEWWFRSRMQTLNVTTWFPPSVTFFRSPSEPSTDDHPQAREGDLLHVDIGITAMNMNTDTQHLGYILRSNETKVPAGLVQGLHDANRLQDFTRKRMVPGLTGDEVFEAVIEDMKDAGLKGLIYSHPIGDYGHSAGAIIGMANIQGSVPGGGQNKVLENYWTSVELSGDTYVPEWGIRQLFPLEEDVYWSPKTRTFEWVYGQQTEYHLVKPKKRESSSPSLFTRIGTSLGWNVVRWV